MADDEEMGESVLELSERRLHLKIFDHWVSLLGGREFPELDEMQSEMEDETLAASFVIDLAPGLSEATLHFAGEQLMADYGGEQPLLGRKIDDLGRYSVIARLADHFLEVVSNRAPIGFEAEFERQDGRQAAYRGILLPFSEDGSEINYILGVISWVDKDAIH
ncbi:MAG: PAS domain-containing protein [Proteobacteria bacterium]|nr:PAS domain-containing protein [Pseudomonadota bacterium]